LLSALGRGVARRRACVGECVGRGAARDALRPEAAEGEG